MQEVRENFLEEVTLILRPGGYQGVLGKWEGVASQCKGPGAGPGLVCWKNTVEARVAGAE